MTSRRQARIWAVVPAAGIGSRMQSELPKQYLQVHGRSVLQHSIERLLDVTGISGVVVSLHPGDTHWQSLDIEATRPVITVTGGAERADSVRLALQALIEDHADDADNTWVLVHDAARPCVDRGDIERLVDSSLACGTGGILATRVKDTMKRADASSNIRATVDRDGLWHALTPQFFPLTDLHSALIEAGRRGVTITDEAGAMELAGHDARLVESSDANIKITRPGDLALAAFYLREQDHERTR